MSHDRAIQVIHHRTLLQPQGLDHGQHSLNESAPRSAVATKRVLPPQNAQTQDPLRMVVGGLDPFDFREQPQRRVQCQDVGAKGRGLGIRAGATPFQNALEFARNPVHPRFQAENFSHNRELVAKIEAMAAQKGCTPAQITLAWLLAQGSDVVAIPGTRYAKRLDENLEALDVTLLPEEVSRISAAVPVGAAAGTRYPAAGMKAVYI